MPRRSIDDDEVALIKAMLRRGMRNRDIQFYFNKPDRPVNSGRITGIANGSYGDAATTPAADEVRLDAFLAKSDLQASSPPGEPAGSGDPLDERALRRLFERRRGRWLLKGGETAGIECKTSFGLRSGAWLRAVAALSNNEGGYVFFGISETGVRGGGGAKLEVIGLANNEFALLDPVIITRRLKSVFDPTPTVRRTVIEFDGRSVGVLHVERHPSRPVMATKQDQNIAEGDIFFRYPGQSARIKYSDLRALLDARDTETRSRLLPMVERLLSLGPERAMIADLREGVITDADRTITIDEDLVRRLTFIKEGQFDEREGAPTLRLVGDVKTSTGADAARTRRGVITRSDLLRAFLDHAAPDDPTEYIRFALEASQGEWLPLLFFARAAGMSRGHLVAFINSTSATAERKRLYIERTVGDAARHVIGGKPRQLLPEILAGRIPAPDDAVRAGHIGLALQGLDRVDVDATALLGLLKRCLNVAEASGDANRVSAVRRAICRVDEVICGPLDA